MPLLHVCMRACGGGCGHHSPCSLRQCLLQAWSSLTTVSKPVGQGALGAISLWGLGAGTESRNHYSSFPHGSGVCEALCCLHLHPVPAFYLLLPSLAFTWGAADLENMWFTETRSLVWEQAGPRSRQELTSEMRRCLKTQLKLPLVRARASHQISNFPSWN